MSAKKEQLSGVYLVLDPSMERATLLAKLKSALAGGVNVVQVWNNWPAHFDMPAKEELVCAILGVAAQVPVLINEEWRLLKNTALAGVHFDSPPADLQAIRQELNRHFICGITCSNNLEVIRWAEEHQADYVSFCSMFASGSVSSCDIVRPETVRQAREMTSIPFFLSGGITTENMNGWQDLDFTGVAVISGILQAESPQKSASAYVNALTKLQK